jgi:hypothetical protein
VWTDWSGPTNIEPYAELHAIAYGNGLWVAGGSSSALWVSPDGNNWTNPAPQLPVDEVKDILYANGGFVAVGGYGGGVWTSPDGLQWSARDLSPEGSWELEAVAFGKGIYVVAGRDRLAASANTTNWHISDVGWDAYARGVAYGNGRFVVVGVGPVLVSTDGTNWARTAFLTSMRKVAFGTGYFVAVGGDYDFGLPESPVWTSEDGITWIRRHVFTGQALLGVAYGNGSFVIGGYPDAILQSDPIIALNLTIGATPNITLSGPVKRTYDIECSNELGTWWPWKTVFADSMPFLVPDDTATNGVRLYRAVLK